MEKICRNCKFWEQRVILECENKDYLGNCHCPKFVYCAWESNVERDGVGYWDEIGFDTGEKFGCIHFKERK